MQMLSSLGTGLSNLWGGIQSGFASGSGISSLAPSGGTSFSAWTDVGKVLGQLAARNPSQQGYVGAIKQGVAMGDWFNKNLLQSGPEQPKRRGAVKWLDLPPGERGGGGVYE